MNRDERTASLGVWSYVMRLIASGTPTEGIKSIGLGAMDQLAHPILEEHKANGFDAVSYDTEDNTFTMKCSQCDVAIINRVTCHEQRCPNKKTRNATTY